MMPTFTLTISADSLPDVEGEQLRATVTNLSQPNRAPEDFIGPKDSGTFEATYVGNYGDTLSVVRDWVLGSENGPDAEAVLVQLPFPLLPKPLGGGVSVRF